MECSIPTRARPNLTVRHITELVKVDRVDYSVRLAIKRNGGIRTSWPWVL